MPATSTPKLASLRSLLAIDAATCTVMGLALGLGAAPIASMIGLPQGLLAYAGLALLPIAAFMALVAWRPLAVAAWLVILGNLAWVAGSVLLLLAGWVSPNALGIAFVIGQAVAVAILAELEYLALRARTAAAAA